MNALTRPDEKTTRGISTAAVELRRRMQAEAREQALRAIAGTDGGADRRQRIDRTTDKAGEKAVAVTSYALDHWYETDRLSWREAAAMKEMARLYRASGGLGAWGGGGPSDHDNEKRQEDARRRYRETLETAPIACRGAIQATCCALATGTAGEYPPTPWLLRPGLASIADHLRLPLDEDTIS